MEGNAEYADSLKTPRRSRRTSITPQDPTSQHKRSVRETIMPDIKEVESAPSDPVTPSRSARILDFQTPSRSESVATEQTPRRSVRKSIKPVQEYENIVAQKGLSSKRAASSSVEAEEESTEGKWTASVIGRASTKRNKKARRAKNKELKRQKRIVEVEVEVGAVDVKLDHNQLNDDKEKIEDDKDCSQENPKECMIVLHEDEQLHDKPSEEDECEGNSNKNVLSEELVVEIDNSNENERLPEEKQSIAESPSQDEEDKIICSSENPDNDRKNGGIVEAIEEASKKVVDSVVHKDVNTDEEPSDSSMEGGDVEMATMPITADDMESPEKPYHLPTTDTNKSFNVLALADSVNKSNDSDCILLESSQADQSDTCPSTGKLIHDSCDSLETNMPPLMVCSDDEEEDIVAAPNKSEETKQPEIEKETEITLLDGTFEIEETPAKKTEPITPETPMLRSSITRMPTPFKSSKAVVPDKIIEPEEEIDSEEVPEVVLEPREITLKSSRKRSFSICTDRPKKFVTFHSPANTTVSIYDGDLMKSTTKEDTDNVTQRRKRSLSVTETDKEMLAYFEQKETTESTPDKRRKVAQPRSRTKMPNFSAIHQQQFQRMESISDHVARKAERAKVILSASKVRPASIQKGFPLKNAILRENNKDALANKSALSMPKARQRIELFGIEHKSNTAINKTFHSGMKVHSKSKPDLSTFDDFPSIGKISSKMNASTTVFTASAKPVHLPRPRFDTNVSTLNAPLNADKLCDRRKRMMDMYKGRTDHRTGEKNKEILKGVRTNRRFELQMMCRNRQN